MDDAFHQRMSMRLYAEKDEEGFSFNVGGTGGIDDLDEYESVYSDIEEDDDAFGFTAKGQVEEPEEDKKKETMDQKIVKEMQSTMETKRSTGRAKGTVASRKAKESGTVFESAGGPSTVEENPSKLKAVFALVKDTVKRSKKSFMKPRESNASTLETKSVSESVTSAKKDAERKATVEDYELEEVNIAEQATTERKLATGFGFFKKNKAKTMKTTTPEERNRIAKQVTKIFDDNQAEPKFEYVNPKVADPEQVEIESANFHEMLHYGNQMDIVVKKKIVSEQKEEES